MTTTGVSSTTTLAPPTTRAPVEGLPGFASVEIILNDEILLVALADTPALRARGLMGVTDLGGLDGMLFAMPEPSNAAFWMKDTLIALDVAFFATDGSLLDVVTMEPCVADPCPTYGIEAPWQWAIEAPAGDFVDLPADSRIDVGRDPFVALIGE